MLNGKVAVVTGGSQGIGRAIALKLAEHGADIAILYVGPAAPAEETVQMIEAMGRKVTCQVCDVSNFDAAKKAVQTIIKEMGGIDILVNNAGITRDNLIFSMKESDYDAVLNVNLKGTFNMIKHCYGHFLKKKAGRIINISSVAGVMGNAGQANYSASKAGVIGLTKATARELGSRRVTCNAIAPGAIRTAMTDTLPEEVRQGMVAMVPLGFMGEADDIANTALFLASPAARYITGEVIKVDGGMAM